MPNSFRGAPVLRLLVRIVVGVATSVLVLLAGVVCFALFPPSDLLRRAAVPIAQGALNHEAFHIGALELRPLSHVEIRDLWLGPPAGYAKPLFSVDRIVVRYDLSRITSGEIWVRQVQVERPFVQAESKAGKLSWLAFVEGLPKSEEPPPEEEPGEPSDMKIWLDRVAVIGFGCDVDDGQVKAALDSLHIALWGLVSRQRNEAHVAVRLEPRTPQRPSISVLKRGEQPLGADLDTRLQVDVNATVRPSLRPDLKPDIQARVGMELSVGSRKLQAPWPLPPLSLETSLSAEADTKEDVSRLTRLQVRFNRTELLALAATVKGVFQPRHVEAVLSRLHLPLDLFAPYARAVMEKEQGRVAFGGTVSLEDMQLSTALGGAGLPRLRGKLAVEGLWAKVQLAGPAGLRARVRGLDLALALGSRPAGGTAAATPTAVLDALPDLDGAVDASSLHGTTAAPVAMLHGRLRLGDLQAAGARVSNLDLRFASGVNVSGALLAGAAPAEAVGAFGSRVDLRLPAVAYAHPKLGRLRLGLRTRLTASGDLTQQLLVLDRLNISLARLLDLDLSARVEEMGRRALQASLELRPAPLAQLLQALPAPIRRSVGPVALTGRLGVDVKLKGKLPAELLEGKPVTPQQLLGLPLGFETRLALNKIGVKDRARKLTVSGLDGAITCKGRPADLKLEGRLAIASVGKPDLQLAVQGLSLPLDVHFTPRRLETKLGLGAQQLFKGDLGLVARGLKLSLGLTTELAPLHRLLAAGRRPPPVGKTRLQLDHGAEAFRIGVAGNTVQTGPITNTMELTYDPGRGHATQLSLGTRIATLAHLEQRARLRGLSFAAKLSTAVPVGALAAGKSVEIGKAAGKVDVKLKQVDMSAPGNALRATGLSTSATVDYDGSRAEATRVATTTRVGTLDHEDQQVRLRKLVVEEKSGVQGIVLRLPQPVIKLARLDNNLTLTVGSLHKRGLPTFRQTVARVDAVVSRELKDVELRNVALRVPSIGAHLELKGSARNLLPFNIDSLPTFSVELDTGLDNPVQKTYQRATPLLPGLRVAGSAGVKLRARHGGGNRLGLDVRLLGKAFSLWNASGTVQREPTGQSLTTVARLHMQNLNMDVPVSQTVTLRQGRVVLPRPKRSIFQDAAADPALYQALRPYGGRRSALSLGGVTLDQTITARDPAGKVISTVRRTNRLDRMSLDLAIRDSSLLLNRFYLKLFAGDIAGAVRAQLLELKPAGIPDVRVHLNTQITGVNTAYLDPAAKERSAKTEISALLDLKVEPCRGYVEGRINITRLSLDMLDSLLAYIDPNRINESVQQNRKMLKAWYIKVANPKVKLVSIWISHGNLNMDIELDAIAPIGTILKRNLRNNRIRRINILPFLPKCRGGAPAEESAP